MTRNSGFFGPFLGNYLKWTAEIELTRKREFSKAFWEVDLQISSPFELPYLPALRSCGTRAIATLPLLPHLPDIANMLKAGVEKLDQL